MQNKKTNKSRTRMGLNFLYISLLNAFYEEKKIDLKTSDTLNNT